MLNTPLFLQCESAPAQLIGVCTVNPEILATKIFIMAGSLTSINVNALYNAV